MLEWGENRRCLSLSACHLAVSLRSACYHTSYERGHLGLPAEIRTIVQLIAIFLFVHFLRDRCQSYIQLASYELLHVYLV